MGSSAIVSKRTRGRSSPVPTKVPDCKRAASTPPESTNDDGLGKLPGGPPSLQPTSNLEKSWTRHQQLSKKKSQYFAEVFAYREANNSAKDRVTRDSMVVAEIKINCYLESEVSFLADLSFQLSEIYQRPESSIMVMVSPKTPILLGGNSEPAYYMRVSALSSEIAPTKNKRSTALIQDFMKECLDIPSRRGVIRFDAIAEENLASHGMTALQEIEELEARSSEDNGVLRTINRNRSRKVKKTFTPIFTERGKTPAPDAGTITPPDTSTGGSTDAGAPLEVKRMKRRKSIMAFFGRQT